MVVSTIAYNLRRGDVVTLGDIDYEVLSRDYVTGWIELELRPVGGGAPRLRMLRRSRPVIRKETRSV